jgi:hypothetical protein
MTVHIFGNYPEKLHPHLQAIVSDGLFHTMWSETITILIIKKMLETYGMKGP